MKNKDILLPLILAGPILRRCTNKEVNIWIATSSKLYDINVEIIDMNKIYNRPLQLSTKCKTSSVKAGENIYFYILTVKRKDEKNTFPTGTVLSYSTSFCKSNTKKRERKNLMSFLEKKDICYKGFKNPTFILQQKRDRLNILYGSCRKLHGPGKDAIKYAEERFIESLKNTKSRISALFLTGDQIYADDVDLSIINYLSKLGKRLTNKNEYINDLSTKDLGINAGYYRGKVNYRPENYTSEKNNRKEFIENIAKFTTSEPEYHLITFGEYIAMYLVSWNPDLWKFDLKSKSNLGEAKTGSTSIRRLMANIPTYMIFDDHEITDDWNLNAEWGKNVNSSIYGKEIIANGLAAYWCFQGWGNDPEKLTHLKEYVENNRGEFLKFHDWAFIAPTYPRALFLNTRTRRDFTQGKDIKFPLLINDNELNNIKKIISDMDIENSLIIVSATPIYGYYPLTKPIENIKKFAKISKDIVSQYDMESFQINKKNFQSFLKLLHSFAKLKRNLNKVIILAGDVHYAFNAIGDTTYNKKIIKIVQFTSSAIKNTPIVTKAGLIYVLTKITQGTKNIILPAEEKKITSRFGYLPIYPDNKNIYVKKDNNIGYIQIDKIIKNSLLFGLKKNKEKKGFTILKDKDWDLNQSAVKLGIKSFDSRKA